MNQKTLSTPTKIILSGEYSVLYGYPAIVIPYDRYTHIHFEAVTTAVTIKEHSIDLEHQYIDQIQELCLRIERYLHIKHPQKFRISFTFEAPVQSGYGVSASIVVGMLRYFLEWYQLSLDAYRFISFAKELENIFHSNSSGLDIAAIYYNQPLVFSSLEKIEVLSFDRHKAFHNCYIYHCGQPQETTQQMVKYVQKKHPKTSSIWSDIGSNTQAICQALKSEQSFYASIQKAGYILEELGIVSPKTISLCRDLRQAGSAVKVCGAGGSKTYSGVLFIMSDDRECLSNCIDIQKLTPINEYIRA